jgi:hypothetical protein
MLFINALRDFADGMTRGLGLFFTERHEYTTTVTAPGLAGRPRSRR